MAHASRRQRAQHDDNETAGAMGFLEHLDELRTRLVRSCLAIAIGMAISLPFYDRLGSFVLEPTLRVLPPGSEFIFTRPSEMFAFYFNVALIGGVVLAAPFVAYQVWRFIAPGLYSNEKRLVVPFLTFATAGAVGGALFSHYVLFPGSMAFFGAFSAPHVRFMPRIEDTFDQYLKMLLAMVLVFQLPPLVLVLARMRLVTARWLWRNMGYAVLIMFILAALLTASQDAWNQAAFAAPMVGLYLVSILIAWAVEPKPDNSETSRGDVHLRLVFAATILNQARRNAGRTSRPGLVDVSDLRRSHDWH